MAKKKFKLKSGNGTSFKMMGSSPVKQLLPKYHRYGDFFYQGDNLQQYEPATSYIRGGEGEENIYETDPRYDKALEEGSTTYAKYRAPGQYVKRTGEDVMGPGYFGGEDRVVEGKGSIKHIGFPKGNYAG